MLTVQSAEIIFDRTETGGGRTMGSGFNWSFGNLFKNKWINNITIDVIPLS
jgi:hypothetical protein